MAGNSEVEHLGDVFLTGSILSDRARRKVDSGDHTQSLPPPFLC
jgi:hypothetical protein